MAVKFRDYYEVLGVSRDAGADDIKRSFRKLARKFHPDVSKGDKEDAELKFKEINEAYEVLSDPEKREKYDLLGENWQHGADFTGGYPGGGNPFGGYGFGGQDDGSGQRYEYHFGGSTGFSDFFESMFGARATGDPFGGSYQYSNRGGGNIPRRGMDVESDLLVTLEEVMDGSERLLQLQKPGADSPTTIKLKIPKGVSKGQTLSLSKMGGPGQNGGETGDLLLRVRLERHPIFQVDKSDLHFELVLAPWEAVLGTTLDVPTLTGHVRLKIPPHSQSGDVMRLRGRGLPLESDPQQNGDLLAGIVIAMPEKISESEEKHWRNLAENSDFNPRGA